MKIENQKEHWLDRQKDQTKKQEARKEKKKGDRKRAREQLRSWESYDEEDMEELE